MGWRAQDAYERARDEERRLAFAALPPRRRLLIRAWTALAILALAIVMAGALWAMIGKLVAPAG